MKQKNIIKRGKEYSRLVRLLNEIELLHRPQGEAVLVIGISRGMKLPYIQYIEWVSPFDDFIDSHWGYGEKVYIRKGIPEDEFYGIALQTIKNFNDARVEFGFIVSGVRS